MTKQIIKAVVHVYEDRVDILIVNDGTGETINFFGIRDPEVVRLEEKFRKVLEEITCVSEAEVIQIIDKRYEN